MAFCSGMPRCLNSFCPEIGQFYPDCRRSPFDEKSVSHNHRVGRVFHTMAVTSISLNRQQLINALVEVLDKDKRVTFAYLYGSIAIEGSGHDVDVAVYPKSGIDDASLCIDLKIELHEKTGIYPELLDIKSIQGIIEKGDILALLYLRNVLEKGMILINKEKVVHADFLERYGRKFRACESLIQELLT